ncbi:hypothetical protein PQQ87_12280 [Paraburkholderia nemoris]|uniref:hypothetical protein n=1 Tax=Paraburkholderia nemoris TaxID=2793076 RepID=UPI0038BB35AD
MLIGLAFKHGRSIKWTKKDHKDKKPVNRHLRVIDRQLTVSRQSAVTSLDETTAGRETMVEPITAITLGSFVTDKAADKLADAGVEWLEKNVTSRWNKYRAKRFLVQLIEELRKQEDIKHESATLNELLAKVIKGDKETSELFDAYRRVALCASKDIGPMVIAVFTAGLWAKNVEAGDEEEQLFMAAEALNDRDFVDFIQWFTEKSAEAMAPKHENLRLPDVPGLRVVERVTAKATRNTFNKGDTPINLFTDVGAFAPKLQNLGVLVHFTRPTRGGGSHRVDHFVGVTIAAIRLHVVASRVATVKHSVT